MRALPPYLLSVLSLLLCGCQSVFFFPEKGHRITPEALSLPYQDVVITTSDGLKVHGWFLQSRGAARANILVLHGNAENVSTHFHSVAWLPQYGYNVLALDYRGYGLSEGRPSIQGAIRDAEAALRYLEEHHPEPIVVYGQSIGGAIALGALVQHRPQQLKAVIIEASFSSYRRIAREKLASLWLTWPLQYPISWLVYGGEPPEQLVQKLAGTPLLFVHGTADPIVPEHHSDILFAKAQDPRWLWKVPEAGHIQAFASPEWRQKLLRFLDTVVQVRGSSYETLATSGSGSGTARGFACKLQQNLARSQTPARPNEGNGQLGDVAAEPVPGSIPGFSWQVE